MRTAPVCYAMAGLVFSLLAAASAAAAPAISSFTPASGTIGNHVVINGSGFTGATAVKFNGVTAAYTVNSDIKITATVPNAASTGLISVTAASSTGASATSFGVTPGVALSIDAGHPYITPTVFGAGFHPSAPVDLYFDSGNVALFVTSPTGTLSTVYQIPGSAQPGQHWITFIERGSYWAAQKAFTVQTDWAQEGFGASGRGVNIYENTLDTGNVGTLTTAWSGNAGGAANQAPFVVAGGSIFVGDVIGQIYAYSKTGALLWTAAGGDMESVNPAAASGRVFFGDSNGNVASYSQTCRSDGGVCAPQWTINIGNAVTAGLTYRNGTLYVPSADGSIHTLNPTTGAPGTSIYGYDTAHGAVTTPVVFDAAGGFFYGAGVTLEYSLAFGSTGFHNYGGSVSPLAVSNGTAYFTTSDGYLHRAPLGSAGWDATTSIGGCVAAPVVAFGYVYAGGCSTLAAYNPKAGGKIWSIGTGNIEGISEANGVIYVCENGILQAYDANYGGYLWTGGWCTSAPEVSNGKVFATFALVFEYDLPSVVGASRPAPSVASLHPDYKLKPQLSGTAVVSKVAVNLSTE